MGDGSGIVIQAFCSRFLVMLKVTCDLVIMQGLRSFPRARSHGWYAVGYAVVNLYTDKEFYQCYGGKVGG